MDETQRLALIAEAVRYCQRVRVMGMPPSSYSKALREPVHFLWERREERNKERAARYRSKASIGLRFGNGGLIYDHAVPFKYLQDALLALSDVTAATVGDALRRLSACALITREENEALNRAGYKSKMPSGWDGLNPLARYEAAGIVIVVNAAPSLTCDQEKS